MKAYFIENEKVFDSYMKMALDEALLLKSVKTGIPILRFYSWNEEAVALGHFQSAEKELKLEECRKNNIEIFRRLTGGGAVFKDPLGEFNYSVVIPEHMITSDIKESHRFINKAVVKGLEKLGVEAYHQGINDICVNGKKISGNAQTRLKGGVLHHGTLLVKFNIQKMKKYLDIPKEKLGGKDVNVMAKAVGVLSDYASFSDEELFIAIKEGFEDAFNWRFESTVYEKEDLKKALELYDKYSSEEWIYMR